MFPAVVKVSSIQYLIPYIVKPRLSQLQLELWFSVALDKTILKIEKPGAGCGT